MPQLKSSYRQFLKANKYKTTIDYLQSYSDEGVGPTHELSFNELDESLSLRLKDSDFIDYAYDRINYDNYWIELPNDQRQILIEKAKRRNPNSYRFNAKSEFSKCIEKLAETDSVAFYYSNLISEIGNPSPTALSNGLLNMTSRFNDYKETIEWVTIINFYYPLLNNEFEERTRQDTVL